MTTLNGRVERLERELVTIIAASSPPAPAPPSGPAPTEDEAQAAWSRVVARLLLDLAQREGRGRPWVARELLGTELLDKHEAAASSAADDAVCARYFAAHGEPGLRSLEECKRAILEQRSQLLLDILNELVGTLVEPYRGQVLADVERKTLDSPVSVHVRAIAYRSLWTQTGEEGPFAGYRGPLCLPEAICQVLVEHPEGAGDLWRDCAECGLVIPSKRLDPPVRSVSCAVALQVCPYCGGTDIGPHRFYDAHRESLRAEGGAR